MVNYYQILGLKDFASDSEIKSAFRNLAKKYHPDINPNGQEKFKVILRAYEVLTNPNLKSTFDYKLKYTVNKPIASNQPNKNPKVKKEWTFEENEIKRRKYYQENYAKYYNTERAKYSDVDTSKKPYNEFKNILIATPLTVLLLMLILNTWTSKPQYEVVKYEEKKPIAQKKVIEKDKAVLTSDRPFETYYGGPKFDTIANCTWQLKNNTNKDVLVLLFAENGFIRSVFIEDSHEVVLENLPRKITRVNIMCGNDFQYINELKEAKLFGAFSKECAFYENEKVIKLSKDSNFVLENLPKQGYKEVSEKEFFTH
ncbi:MAG: J domain-containing protein [Bacteroidia bacterium]